MGLKLKGVIALVFGIATIANAAPETWSFWNPASKTLVEYVRHRSGFWGPNSDGPYIIRRDDATALLAVRQNGHKMLSINKLSGNCLLTGRDVPMAGYCYHFPLESGRDPTVMPR
jgi:hypothetical protein